MIQAKILSVFITGYYSSIFSLGVCAVKGGIIYDYIRIYEILELSGYVKRLSGQLTQISEIKYHIQRYDFKDTTDALK